ncbi:hypothetical protein Q3A66_16615 [Hymenobacter sp. BT770]|uniref:hypothetical protein n=1 Tax=Hymenobacter sp. BT770 TaxID=2886942 RepID=UPI001D11260A|nr:hypothetical protein [Hymenobacter sp. BT770]MCC3154640.1 hypothetical protein [Hymenobacter sp. BT770]MDO3416693.1 hypothetical protein [Hymenobacter sp. BT770]
MARLHPYNFAHVLLPQLAWRRPTSVRRELSDPYLARELLHYVWDKAAENLAPAEKVAPKGLRLSWHEVAGRVTALFHLPPPQATMEAHYSALVYEEDEDAAETEAEEKRPRYFTLEATLGLAGPAGTPTEVGEWAGEVHRHLGRGPAAGQPNTLTAFLEALATVLGPLPPETEVPFMRVVRS